MHPNAYPQQNISFVAVNRHNAFAQRQVATAHQPVFQAPAYPPQHHHAAPMAHRFNPYHPDARSWYPAGGDEPGFAPVPPYALQRLHLEKRQARHLQTPDFALSEYEIKRLALTRLRYRGLDYNRLDVEHIRYRRLALGGTYTPSYPEYEGYPPYNYHTPRY